MTDHPPIRDIREALDALNSHQGLEVLMPPDMVPESVLHLCQKYSKGRIFVKGSARRILNYLLRNWDELIAQPESLYHTEEMVIKGINVTDFGTNND